MMNKVDLNSPVISIDQIVSRAGYSFSLNDNYWALDKNIRLPVHEIYELIDKKILPSYLKTLRYYAENLSSAHTNNIHTYMMHMLRSVRSEKIDEVALINYRAALDKGNEYYLGTIRGFLRRWHELGYAGVSDDVIELLDGWIIKGNIKGDVIKRLDPVKGPLSDIELQAFNEGAIQAFERI